mmetsp:Transcript_25616/g.71571  ORF Transcript_25616/g.71571 Transcript_25616/m.71571 type:complete len:591 (+) Transcript_25616:373-2145(+)
MMARSNAAAAASPALSSSTKMAAQSLSAPNSATTSPMTGGLSGPLGASGKKDFDWAAGLPLGGGSGLGGGSNGNGSNPAGLGGDSLLGMAASLFGGDQGGNMASSTRSMLPQDNAAAAAMLTPQEQLARSVDITSQVLSELPADIFDDGNFSNDLFDQTELEPLPVDPRRMNVVGRQQHGGMYAASHLQQQHQQQSQNHTQSSLAVLEETLNVLNQDIEFDIFQQQHHHHHQHHQSGLQAPHGLGAQQAAAMMNAAAAASSNAGFHRHQHQHQHMPLAVPSNFMLGMGNPAAMAQQMGSNGNSGSAAFSFGSMPAVSSGMAMGTPSANKNKRSTNASPKRATKKQRTHSGAAAAPSTSAKKSPASASSSPATADDDKNRFRPYQSEQWSEKFDELLEFKKNRGHCCVPHTFEENPALARWVKRQRYQYKLKNEGKQSTMTDERVRILEDVGFIWDSHSAAWFDRLNELRVYRKQHGNCNVPSNYPANPQLATWVKCQRRQYKLFWEGSKTSSNMTIERIAELEKLDFEWELRSHGKSKNKGRASPKRQQQQILRQQLQQQQQQQQQRQMAAMPGQPNQQLFLNAVQQDSV